MCFLWISEQTAIISQYSINWRVCITETESVYSAVRAGYLHIILRSAHAAVFMCFVWVPEQTAIISLYSINWLIFSNRGGECLLHGTDCVFKYREDDLSLQYQDKRRNLETIQKTFFFLQKFDRKELSLWSLNRGTVTGISASITLYPCQYHFTTAPHPSSVTCCSDHRDKRANHWNLT